MEDIPGNQRAYLQEEGDIFLESSQSSQSSYDSSGIIFSTQDTIQDDYPIKRSIHSNNSTQDSNETEQNTLESEQNTLDDSLDNHTIDVDTMNDDVVKTPVYRKIKMFNIFFKALNFENLRRNNFRLFIFDLIDKYYEKVNLTCNLLMGFILILYLLDVIYKNIF